MAEGTTIIENAARNRICRYSKLFKLWGADAGGTDVIKIRGVNKRGGCSHTVIPDQIEAGTYMIAAAVAGGDNRQHYTETFGGGYR